MLAGSSNADADASRQEELEFNHAFNANVSNFVTVKLSGHENYDIWHAQMMCLLEVCNMSGFIDHNDAWYSSKSPKILKRYDNLLKGWVISSIDQEVLKCVAPSDRDFTFQKIQSLFAPHEPFLGEDLPYFDPMLFKVSPNDNENAKLMTELLNATMEGSWWKAKAILKNYEDAATKVISNTGDTMLHLAVKEGKNVFVNQLLNFIKDESKINIRNSEGRTALHTAVIVDNKQAAELLVNKNNELLYVQDNNYNIPLVLAYFRGQINTFLYLDGVTRDRRLVAYSNNSVYRLLAKATVTKQYDLALKLVKIPQLLRFTAANENALMALTSDFPPELGFWEALIYPWLPIKHIEKKKRDYGKAKKVLKLICNEMNKRVDVFNYEWLYGPPIREAARVDACEVVVEILHGFEGTQVCRDERGHNIFQIAIINRSEKVYNLLSPGIKHSDQLRRIQDHSENRLTHLAAKLASSIVLSRTTGAALQLQRELQWHEEVKKLMLPIELTYKNINEETSDMVFTREHAALLKEGEQWMKTTAESCSITAALIVTIVFAAAITVPGGSNQETGIPLFKKEMAFTIFAVCDALSLFTAATALLVFLSILTTRFAEKDFLVSLPRRLIIGLCALIISTTAMMIAFGAILFLVFCDQRPWMLAPIGLFACLPISVIVTLQLPLLIDLFQSTYISRFSKQKSH